MKEQKYLEYEVNILIEIPYEDEELDGLLKDLKENTDEENKEIFKELILDEFNLNSWAEGHAAVKYRLGQVIDVDGAFKDYVSGYFTKELGEEDDE